MHSIVFGHLEFFYFIFLFSLYKKNNKKHIDSQD